MSGKLNLWPADKMKPGQRVMVVGRLWLLDTDALGHNKLGYGKHYFELMQLGFGEEKRWPVFGDIRQLGVNDSQRRALLRGTKRGGETRMVITDLELAAARENKQEPQMPFVTVMVKPSVNAPGLPCTVKEGSNGALRGHNVLVIDRDYRAPASAPESSTSAPLPKLHLPSGLI